MAEVAATKSAALALADERALMRQGYQFLDEKRMLLAAELLRTLAAHREQEAALVARLAAAGEALREALQVLCHQPPRAGLQRAFLEDELGTSVLAAVDDELWLLVVNAASATLGAVSLAATRAVSMLSEVAHA